MEIVEILTVVSSYWRWKPRQTRRSERWVSSFPFSKNTETETQVSIYIFFAGRPFGPGTPAYRRTRFIAGRLSFVPAMA